MPRTVQSIDSSTRHRAHSLGGALGGRDCMNIRLLLIDDFPLIREGFAAALESDPGLKIVGQADNGEEGLRLARELQPDVVVLDLSMPGMGGMTVLEKLRSESPETKVLVVTATEKAQPLLDAVAAGAAGYLTKRPPRGERRPAGIPLDGGGPGLPAVVP